jgi:hypothetical protein
VRVFLTPRSDIAEFVASKMDLQEIRELQKTYSQRLHLKTVPDNVFRLSATNSSCQHYSSLNLNRNCCRKKEVSAILCCVEKLSN